MQIADISAGSHTDTGSDRRKNYVASLLVVKADTCHIIEASINTRKSPIYIAWLV